MLGVPALGDLLVSHEMLGRTHSCLVLWQVGGGAHALSEANKDEYGADTTQPKRIIMGPPTCTPPSKKARAAPDTPAAAAAAIQVLVNLANEDSAAPVTNQRRDNAPTVHDEPPLTILSPKAPAAPLVGMDDKENAPPHIAAANLAGNEETRSLGPRLATELPPDLKGMFPVVDVVVVVVL